MLCQVKNDLKCTCHLNLLQRRELQLTALDLQRTVGQRLLEDGGGRLGVGGLRGGGLGGAEGGGEEDEDDLVIDVPH